MFHGKPGQTVSNGFVQRLQPSAAFEPRGKRRIDNKPWQLVRQMILQDRFCMCGRYQDYLMPPSPDRSMLSTQQSIILISRMRLWHSEDRCTGGTSPLGTLVPPQSLLLTEGGAKLLFVPTDGTCKTFDSVRPAVPLGCWTRRVMLPMP